MPEQYIAYHFTVEPLQPATDILMAELGQRNFDSFVEHDTGFTAYILKSKWYKTILDNLYILNNQDYKIDYSKELIEPINWNKAWEKNFDPIEVDQTVSIRAPFHSAGQLKYNIVIEPKMSFGTGHHETTYLMIQQLLQLSLSNKKVLDMGTGTGVLAILTEFLGAQHIDAVDIDQWSYENANENVDRNNCQNINVFLGDASWLDTQSYDVILANITRNILLEDIPTYVKHLNPKGVLVLSGFYKEDLSLINDKTTELSLIKNVSLYLNNWACASFLKS